MKSAVVSPVKAISGVDTVLVICKNYELVRGLYKP
jgi:arginine repressor